MWEAVGKQEGARGCVCFQLVQLIVRGLEGFSYGRLPCCGDSWEEVESLSNPVPGLGTSELTGLSLLWCWLGVGKERKRDGPGKGKWREEDVVKGETGASDRVGF